MRLALIATAAALTLAAPRARAEPNPDLAEARAHLEELRFADAGDSLERALEAGNSSPQELVEIYKLLGEVRASLGRPEAAVKAFKHALALAPELDLGDGLSPRITGPFERAAEFFAENRPLAVLHELRNKARLVILNVDADPFEMVAGGRATFWTESGEKVEVLGEGTAPIEMAVPEGAVSFTAAVVDARGNRLVEFGTPSDRIALPVSDEELAAPIPTPKDEDQDDTPIYARWWLWGGVSAGFAAAGAAFGLSAQGSVTDIQERVDDSGNYEFADVAALEDRARQRALLANISFGVAGVCAAATLYLLLQEGEEKEPQRRPETAFTPVVDGDAVGVSATVRF